MMMILMMMILMMMILIMILIITIMMILMMMILIITIMMIPTMIPMLLIMILPMIPMLLIMILPITPNTPTTPASATSPALATCANRPNATSRSAPSAPPNKPSKKPLPSSPTIAPSRPLPASPPPPLLPPNSGSNAPSSSPKRSLVPSFSKTISSSSNPFPTTKTAIWRRFSVSTARAVSSVFPSNKPAPDSSPSRRPVSSRPTTTAIRVSKSVFPPIFIQLLGVSQALLQLKACILRQKRILAADLRRNTSSASSASSRGSFARPGVTSGGPATYLFGPRQRRALVFPPFSANVGLTASAMKPPSSKRPPCRSPSQAVRNSRQDPFSRFPNRYRFPAVFLQILLTMSRAIVTWCARDTSLPREERVNALWRVWLAVSLTEPRKSVAEQALLEAFRLQRQHRDVLRGDGGVAFSYYASLWENRGNAI